MSNQSNLSLYLAANGDATAATAATEWDGENSILVAATSKAAALEVAAAYDRGAVQADNLTLAGQTVACVYLRDNETGDYL